MTSCLSLRLGNGEHGWTGWETVCRPVRTAAAGNLTDDGPPQVAGVILGWRTAWGNAILADRRARRQCCSGHPHTGRFAADEAQKRTKPQDLALQYVFRGSQASRSRSGSLPQFGIRGLCDTGAGNAFNSAGMSYG